MKPLFGGALSHSEINHSIAGLKNHGLQRGVSLLHLGQHEFE